MPKGPRGQRRPNDVVGAAIKVGRIAVGDVADDGDDVVDNVKDDPVARARGAKGGAARAKALDGNKRSAIAKKAAAKRWKKK